MSNRVTVAGRTISTPRHVCAFFDSKDQRYDVLAPYFAEGIGQGEQIMTICDSELIPDHLAQLSARGIDTERSQASGHLCALCTDETYLPGGSFGKKKMYDKLKVKLDEIGSGPYTGLRTWGDMSWALRNMPGTEELLEYESEINDLLDPQTNATFVCMYDASHVTGKAMLDILGTHNYVLMGNVLHENPYYLTPEEYRRTILARRGKNTELSHGMQGARN